MKNHIEWDVHWTFIQCMYKKGGGGIKSRARGKTRSQPSWRRTTLWPMTNDHKNFGLLQYTNDNDLFPRPNSSCILLLPSLSKGHFFISKKLTYITSLQYVHILLSLNPSPPQKMKNLRRGVIKGIVNAILFFRILLKDVIPKLSKENILHGEEIKAYCCRQ